MDFIDRGEEMKRLRRTSASGEGGLVVVWGRRRVGKTRLLLEWTRAANGVYWAADESAAPLQRRYLAETLELRLPGFGQVEYRDWRSLLERLVREARAAGWRGPLVIDELPYLLRVSPELPAILQRFVDHEARQAGFTLAVAGSSQRMMQGLVLSASAPLYGRARELLKLSAIPAGYLGEALGLRAPEQCVRAWALWGGIPRYWELAAPLGDLREAVDTLVLDPLGALHEEPSRLLLEESPPAIALRPLLDAIGAGAHRVSELAGRIGQPASSLSRPLTRLQELGLIIREVPFGEPERSSKRALYRLADPFLRFWFSVVAPKRSVLMQVPRATRLQLFDEALPRLCAEAWEELCRLAVPLLGALWGVDFGPARRYWAGSGPEWDVVAEPVSGEGLLLGEVKWMEGEVTTTAVEQALQSLLAKGVPPVRHSAGAPIHYAVFVPRKPRRAARLPGAHMHLVDAGDVLSVLR
jgi:uncharacterized protein